MTSVIYGRTWNELKQRTDHSRLTLSPNIDFALPFRLPACNVYSVMIIDLRADMADFRNYVSQLIDEHVRKGDPKPGIIHFGFTFDQDGWVYAYLDTRPNASRDGEWTTHLQPETLLPRPHWYEASELSNLGDLVLIGINGNEAQEWAANPTLQKLADILGEFLKWSVATFEAENLFQPLLGLQKLNYCVEEFTGLYGWPIDPEVAKLVEPSKHLGPDSDSRSNRERSPPTGP